MPVTLSETFTRANNSIDGAKSSAQVYASRFTIEGTREEVMRVHQEYKPLISVLASAQAAAGIDAYAQEQWGPAAPGFTTKTSAIISAANDVVGWIETNFPTVRSTLNQAMTALSIPPAQQEALRSQMGSNLDFVLTHQIQSGVIVSPVLPAAALSPLVTLLNALATAATIP